MIRHEKRGSIIPFLTFPYLSHALAYRDTQRDRGRKEVQTSRQLDGEILMINFIKTVLENAVIDSQERYKN